MPPRLSGARGSVYLADSVTKLADSYSWEFELQQEVLECSIKGEAFRRYVADVGYGRVRIQSFVTATSPLTSVMNTDLPTTAGVGTPVDFTLHGLDPSTPTVTGQGYIVRSQLHVARDGILTDEMEIEVDGPLGSVL